MTIADTLERHLQENNIPYERHSTWDDAERQLVDQYGEGEIAKVLQWALAHRFWRNKVRGMPWFRNKYPEIRHQALSAGVKPPVDDLELETAIADSLARYRRTLARAIEDDLRPDLTYGESRPAFTQQEIDAMCARKEEELRRR